MTTRQDTSLADAFERALGSILARVSLCADATNGSEQAAPTPAIGVAYSGGLDSSVLLHLAQAFARSHGLSLQAFHIHHGLSPNADAWLAHCERECAALDVVLKARRISLPDHREHGVEQAARIGRYAALGELCRVAGVQLLLTAHHLDDQAESVLLQLLRGAGMAGCSGMDSVGSAPELLGSSFPLLARPLLDMTRAELEQFARARLIAHVDDESNADMRYARNALRHRVMPVLSKHFPGFQHRIARSAKHAQSAQRLLEELAANDLACCARGGRIDIARLADLSADRIDNLLRYWLGLHGLRMPSTAWLEQARRQLLDAHEDAKVCIRIEGWQIRRHRGRIFLLAAQSDPDPAPAPLEFRWNAEPVIEFPAFGGSLHFESAREGIDAEWLRTQDLVLGWRRGGERLRAAPNRPGRSLKQHYQALDIPYWERLRLPLVTASGRLLYAAGIGMNWPPAMAGDGTRVQLRWEPA